jgi:acyl-CoA synthetase (AMP-forming)/AMP-acid ligase II
MFHVSQVPRVHVSPLKGGYKSYVMRRFELETWMRNIKRYQITELNMVPMMVILILNSGHKLVNKDTFASVRNMTSGAGPLDSALQARFRKFLREDAPFNQVWGMSETTCICTIFYHPEMDTSGGVGRMLPNHDAKVVDDDGNDVTAYGVVGELCVRGPCIVPRYYGNEKVTNECWDKDGYFHTGDMAYISEENKSWYIVDRKKVRPFRHLVGFG